MQLYRIALFVVEVGAIAIGLRYWKHIGSSLRLITIQVAFGLTIELLGLIIIKYQSEYNSWLFNIYALVETLFLIVVFTLLMKSRSTRVFSSCVAIGMVAWWGVTIRLHGLFKLNNWYIITMALLAIILFAIVLMSKSVFAGQNLYKQPVFIVSVSYMLYYASIIPLFGMFNYLVETNYVLAGSLQNINMAAAILRYMLIGLALYLHGRNTASHAYE